MSRIPVPISVVDTAGNAQQNISATVKNRASGTNVNLYSAETGGSAVTNPLTTDVNGRAFAYTDRQGLRIDYTGTGFTPYTEYRGDAVPPLDIVSALPGSPFDGQEIYYQNAAMATAGVVWHFRYRSGGGTYKWEFLGGPALYSEVAVTENINSASYVALTTAGPSVALPLGGDFDVSIGFRPDSVTATSNVFMSYDIGATSAVDADALSSYQAASAQPIANNTMRTRRKTGLTAVTLTAKYKSTTASSTAITNRWMSVLPIRVG